MNKPFLEYFKISEEEALRYQPHDGISFLESLFIHERLSESEYLQWAKSHYELPILKEGFLETENQIQTLVARYKNIFPKNIVPFYEWDGVLYLLCLEPADIKAPQKIQFILAPYSLIQKWNPETIQIQKPSVDNVLESSLKVNTSTSEAPEGLPNFDIHLNMDPNSIQFDIENDPEAITSILETSADPIAPEGLSFPKDPNDTLTAEYIVNENINSSDLMNFKNQNSPATVQPTTAPLNSEDLSETTHTGIIIQSTGAAGIINSMKKYFDQAMILIYENENLKALKWDGSWSKLPHAQNSIDLKSASIFRIVFDTKFPYHGHVIPNTINDSFFQAWNKGIYPEHVTLVPIVQNKQLLGMLLGTCTKMASTKFQLRHIESIAESCLKEVLLPQLQKAS